MLRKLVLIFACCVSLGFAQPPPGFQGFPQRQQPFNRQQQPFESGRPGGDPISAAIAPAPGRGGDRPFRQFPPYKAICKFLKNPRFVNQQVECALEPDSGACSQGVSKHLQGISSFLREALPAAAGRSQCSYCTQDDFDKIQFIAKYMLRHYPRQSRALVDRYRDEINAHGGIQGVRPNPSVPDKCPEE